MKKLPLPKTKYRIWAIAFWILAWEAASRLIGLDILLASPFTALRRLAEMSGTAAFWLSVGRSTGRILLGYALAVALGIVLGALSSRFRRVKELLAPPVAAIKSVPVASFVIVALVWVSSGRLSTLISFLIAFPLLYTGTMAGIDSADRDLIEMADVFRVKRGRRILHIYLPAAFPYLRSASSVAMGLAWKSGVAAEVIGIPNGTIGEALYRAKVYLLTGDLFAWTIAIVLASLLCEWAVAFLMKRAAAHLEEL